MPRTTRGLSLVAAPPLQSTIIDESIASNVYAAIKQDMRKQRKDTPFYIIKKYYDIVFKII
ncbi:predicted protein [Pyrenophora tritici-repentis Pt-1C-BFP]|uniref:Uncharacterized protein n=1 Tax=Pyrenophora tritici-repentis (strain Pt-1C-BFP) TaxID=426418 RepID=B2WI55_PYRTR|nr:uncharacterized protein PTRG_09664 [Pyrenophora tritici-repentis Pt-1C-BFP]EDU42715.1 predicted protein [Pyrenophora tritici-repentis Pt-1C-BFP]